MQKPLPFLEAAILFLRNTRVYTPIDSNIGERLGIHRYAAIAIVYIGQIGGLFAMCGVISLLMDPLLTDPSSLSKLAFVAAIFAAFVLGQSLASYAIYRLWLYRWPAKA